MDGERGFHGEKNRNTSELAESAVSLREIWEHENLKIILLTTSTLRIRKYGLKKKKKKRKYGLRGSMGLESDLHINPSNIPKPLQASVSLCVNGNVRICLIKYCEDSVR